MPTDLVTIPSDLLTPEAPLLPRRRPGHVHLSSDSVRADRMIDSMSVTLWIVMGAVLVAGALINATLLRLAAGRRPDGSNETVLQVDAENRAVFGRTDHEEWDGEVSITRPTDPRIVKQVQKLRRERSD